MALKDLLIKGVPEKLHQRIIEDARRMSYREFDVEAKPSQVKLDAVQVKKDKFDTDNPKQVTISP